MEDDESPTTFHAAEKEHIVRVLRETRPSRVGAARSGSARLRVEANDVSIRDPRHAGIAREDYVRSDFLPAEL